MFYAIIERMEYNRPASERIASAVASRRLFELAMHSGPSLSRKRQLSTDDARRMIVQADVAPHYSWLKEVPVEHICEIMDDVEAFREIYRAENGKYPSDLRTYAAFRLADEAIESPSGTSRAQILEALMGGDIKNGKLPVMQCSTRRVAIESDVRTPDIDLLI